MTEGKLTEVQILGIANLAEAANRRQECRDDWDKIVRDEWDNLALWQREHCVNENNLKAWWPRTKAKGGSNGA